MHADPSLGTIERFTAFGDERPSFVLRLLLRATEEPLITGKSILRMNARPIQSPARFRLQVHSVAISCHIPSSTYSIASTSMLFTPQSSEASDVSPPPPYQPKPNIKSTVVNKPRTLRDVIFV